MDRAMRALPKGTAVAALAVLLVTAWARHPAHADASSPVVAKVGALTITADDLARRIAAVPAFQLRTMGKTPDEIRKNFLERVLVREMLLVQGAEDAKIGARPEVEERIRSSLRGALLAQIRSENDARTVSDDEVKAYYEAHRDKFNSPPRVALWRILVASKDDAQKLLDELKKDLTTKRWNDLAREQSLDKATSMRGGSLGFIAPDGSSSEPGVKVDAALVAAASSVKDSELVATPVQEGERWAVVWRRQSMKAIARSLEDEAASIKQMLAHEKSEKAIEALVAKLRKDSVSELHPEVVDQLEIGSGGDLSGKPHPGVLPTSKRPSSAPPAPKPGPNGLR
jgi:peptidyl-prolyl cis-trans isomerase C